MKIVVLEGSPNKVRKFWPPICWCLLHPCTTMG